MSVKVMGLVWDLKISREEKFILLAYADHADHDGGSIFPRVSTIAEKTGYSERSTQRITRLLEDSGYLVGAGGQKGGAGITAHWYIPMKGDKIAPIPKGDISDSKRVTNETEKGDIAVSPDPSVNHQLEPSEEEEGKPNIFELYQNNIGVIGGNIMADTLLDAEKTYPFHWIEEAISIAVKNNARRWAYVETILERWRVNGKDDGYKKKKKGADLSAFDEIEQELENVQS
jgi:DnaD/phage-associated family protein